ncbi:hypothetical protein [Cellulomonas soli]|uniref:Uncharacterized protein n=1 Tax=Cellulomonas soli TaxID=931535 RepID=A0A512PB96_9CELL|nr:hypothetical protein [Cellulomonas soli]NYI61103.1 hypothetical protein [Cellulomonas soli]GEP68480.1 hypothetical protein CSO01_11950 [Cellulomonas soli]
MTSNRLPPSVIEGPSLTGPELAVLLHLLAAATSDVLDPGLHVPALVADVALLLDGSVLQRPTLEALDEDLGPSDSTTAPADPRVSRLALAALVCWLAADPQVHRHPGVVAAAGRAGGAAAWFVGVLAQVPRALAGLRPSAAWVGDAEGREELARAFLASGGLLPAGEDDELASDRWFAVSSVHQRHLVAALAQEQRQAEELARRLAEQRAKEAAAQYANY